MGRRVSGGCAPIEYLVLGPIQNNVYLIGDDDALVLVDPSCQPNAILKAVGDRKVAAIFITHFHWDHVGAARALRDATGAPVIASAVDAPIVTGEKRLPGGHRPFEHCPVDRLVSEGDAVEVGPMTWRVMETPGHTPGSICFYLDSAAEAQGAPVLVSGDTLFRGTHGRTDFVGGDPAAMRHSLRKLAKLPKETIVLPGHNAQTTMGLERRWIG